MHLCGPSELPTQLVELLAVNGGQRVGRGGGGDATAAVRCPFMLWQPIVRPTANINKNLETVSVIRNPEWKF